MAAEGLRAFGGLITFPLPAARAFSGAQGDKHEEKFD